MHFLSYRNLNKFNSDRPLPFGLRSGTAIGTKPIRPSLFGKRGCPKGDSARAKRVPIWRSNKGRSLWENLVLGAIMVGMIYVAVLYYGKVSDQAKRKVLESDMRNLRLGISLYLYMNGTVPKDIRDLEEKECIEYTAGGELIKREYVKLITKDGEGYPLDPFGNRYTYNPETGMVHPTTPGYEN